MLFKKKLFAVVLCFLSHAALSQGVIYHCVKDGKKILSDQPCPVFGSNETKRIRYVDLPPVNTVQPVTPEQRVQSQKVTERINVEEVQARQKREYEQAKAEEDKRLVEKQCADLWRYKDSIVAQQRRGNNDWWNSEHRRVNDEIYRLKCGS